MEVHHGVHYGLEQKNMMSQEMQFSMKILQMSAWELTAFLHSEYVENPVLEMDESESDAALMDKYKLESLVKNREEEPGTIVKGDDAYVSPFEFISREKTLQDHLEEQLLAMTLSEAVAAAANFVIFSLDSKGLFTESVEESAAFLEIPEAVFLEGLAVVRSLEPEGIASASVAEALIFQLKKKGIYKDLHKILLEDHLPDIAAGNFRKTAQVLQVKEVEIQKALEELKELEPYPSRGFAMGSSREYILPDARIQKVGDTLQITMLGNRVPRLYISSEVKALLEKGGAEMNGYLKSSMDRAMHLIRSIALRKSILETVIEFMIRYQRAYLLEERDYLEPLSMKELAQKLEIHESTVSRAVRDKYLCTPRGTLALKSLFSELGKSEGQSASTDYIKGMLKELLEKEDPRKPLSDQVLSDLLKERGILLQRRTVAKYREELGIPSTKVRKRL